MEAMVLVTHDEAVWERFVSTALLSMTKFRDDEISLSQACDAVDRFDKIDSEIVQFVCDSISERYGFPRSFSALIDLLSRNPTPEQMRSFMESAP
jgi:hypothetical protein